MSRHKVINKTTFEVFIVNKLDGYSEVEWIRDPADTDTFRNVDRKYWKLNATETDILEMSQEEKDTVDSIELQECVNKRIDDLWNSCYEYQNSFFNEPIWTKIGQMQMAGDPRALEIDAWINGLWNEYYTRRYMIYRATDLDSACSISTNFSDFGEPPYRVYELLGVTL